MRTFLNMDDSFESINLFCGVAASRDSNENTMYLPLVPYYMHST